MIMFIAIMFMNDYVVCVRSIFEVKFVTAFLKPFSYYIAFRILTTPFKLGRAVVL